MLQSRLKNALDDQHVFLDSKFHVKWLKDVDRNTKLFHAASKVRRTVNTFKATLEDVTVTDDREEVDNMAASFFQDLLGQFSVSPRSDYFDDIAHSFTSSDNEMLTKIPIADEIWDVVRNLPKDSAPGPDGFNGSFSKLVGILWVMR